MGHGFNCISHKKLLCERQCVCIGKYSFLFLNEKSCLKNRGKKKKKGEKNTYGCECIAVISEWSDYKH